MRRGERNDAATVVPLVTIEGHARHEYQRRSLPRFTSRPHVGLPHAELRAESDGLGCHDSASTETIGETGSAKLAAGGLYSRREENCDWLFEGSVEAEDRNDVLSALHAAGKLHGTWTPVEEESDGGAGEAGYSTDSD